jgi:hypothetical protein
MTARDSWLTADTHARHLIDNPPSPYFPERNSPPMHGRGGKSHAALSRFLVRFMRSQGNSPAVIELAERLLGVQGFARRGVSTAATRKLWFQAQAYAQGKPGATPYEIGKAIGADPKRVKIWRADQEFLTRTKPPTKYC